MTQAEWWSQPFAPEGSAASEGIRRQLGRSTLDPLAVLIRETAQNSWDARRPGQRVHFRVDIRAIDGDAAEAWGRHLLPEPSPPAAFGLEHAMSRGELTLLTISDYGTTGLGGPIRADEESREPADFANLVRNIGEPRDKELGGGTYGFGKGILFTLSRCGTVLVRSHCRWRGRTEIRLMGATLADSFARDNRRYTGRHWWGEISSDGYVDPVLDHPAEEIAQALGLPRRDPDDLGTDFIIIDPDLGLTDAGGADDEPAGLRTRSEAGTFLASAILWNLWPKMLSGDGEQPQMTFQVGVDGHDVPIPDPANYIRLRPFVDAYRKLEEDPPLMRLRPRTRLGHYADAEQMAPTRDHPLDVAAPFSGPAHHCALMRQAELIVAYREGPVHPDPMLQYGGVFRSDRDVDNHFADAEPPTHDDWVAAQLDGEGRSIVRVALRRIDERMRAIAAGTDQKPSSHYTQVPLGALSSEFATLISSVAGTGGSARPASRPRATSTATAPLVRTIDAPRLQSIDGVPYVVAEAEVLPSPDPIKIEAVATVVLDSGRETDPPVGVPSPTVTSIRATEGDHEVRGSSLVIQPDHPRRYRAYVKPAPDATTRVRFVGTRLPRASEEPRT